MSTSSPNSWEIFARSWPRRRTLISSMHSPDADAESDELTDAFRDVSVDLQSAIDTIDQSSTLVSNLLDTYESLKSDALNNLVKRLTVLSIMLALVALIPSIFGISLNVSPFRNGYQGYLISLFLMGLLGLAGLGVARRHRLDQVAAEPQLNMFATAVNASAMLPRASPSLTRLRVV